MYLKGKDQQSPIYAVLGLKKKDALKLSDYKCNLYRMIDDKIYPFLIPIFSKSGKRKFKRSQILGIVSEIVRILFDSDHFELMKQFVDNIEPHLYSKFPKILTHWKERAAELVKLVEKDYEIPKIDAAKHWKLNFK